MPIKLNTASGGGVILTGANTASDKTITVPADDGTMIYANSSGNVGIGTSSPRDVAGYVSLGLNDTTGGLLDFYANGTRVGGIVGVSGSIQIGTATATPLIFNTDTNERARIDSSGNLLVNQTSQSSSSKLAVAFSDATNQGIGVKNTGGSGGRFVQFLSSGGSEIGSIQQNGASATSYVTSSDYRLKENIQPMTGALAKVAALKPCTYTWKLDGESSQGFIAHELAEVVPECVTGEKDAVNEDGSIKPQGIDTSFLVATLTAAIKEQQQMIETLQAKVAALEAK